MSKFKINIDEIFDEVNELVKEHTDDILLIGETGIRSLFGEFLLSLFVNLAIHDEEAVAWSEAYAFVWDNVAGEDGQVIEYVHHHTFEHDADAEDDILVENTDYEYILDQFTNLVKDFRLLDYEPVKIRIQTLRRQISKVGVFEPGDVCISLRSRNVVLEKDTRLLADTLQQLV